jgi:membrane protein DedA with SNARE-associated domain
MSAFDPFWWWAGRRYGDSVTRIIADRNPRAARGVERGLRLFRRRGGWTLVFARYLPVPSNVLYAAAGWTGYSFLRFAVLDLIGTMLRVVVDVGLGYALGSRAEHAAGLVTRYSIAATVALITGMVAVAWWRRRRDQASSGPLTVGASRRAITTATAGGTRPVRAQDHPGLPAKQ